MMACFFVKTWLFRVGSVVGGLVRLVKLRSVVLGKKVKDLLWMVDKIPALIDR